jgi:hypothetical protein
MYYKQKYLKYKNKYLNLQTSISKDIISAKQVGGNWWDHTSKNNNNLSLFPCESFIKTSYIYNYILHSQIVEKLSDIENLNLVKNYRS